MIDPNEPSSTVEWVLLLLLLAHTRRLHTFAFACGNDAVCRCARRSRADLIERTYERPIVWFLSERASERASERVNSPPAAAFRFRFRFELVFSLVGGSRPAPRSIAVLCFLACSKYESRSAGFVAIR